MTALSARLLRLLPAETAHGLALRALEAGLFRGSPVIPDGRLATSIAGLPLANPIGLAAGFDKDVRAPDALLALGFGFVECGTVTPLPQPGNPKPRMFRLSADQAVINRLGFNSAGLEAFAERMARRRRRGVVGANLGANARSVDRIADYVAGLTRLWGLADYFAVNVSSPNTAGLRALQEAGPLEALLGALAEARARLERQRPSAAPVFLKVAPDLDAGRIEAIVGAARRFGIDGLIVTNTTIERPADLRSRHRDESGGLSGAPLRTLAARRLAEFHAAAAGALTLIAAGGIDSGAEAYARIRAGASAVQIYTAFAYEGPSLALRIAADLAGRLAADGFASVAAAVGA